MGWKETNVSREWLKKWASWAVLFRTQSGGLWGGKVVKQWSTFENGKETKWVTLRSASFIKVGVEGISDHNGYKSIIIPPSMVGKKAAIYVAAESKTDEGVVSKEQEHYLKTVALAGGISFVIRSEDTVPPEWGN